MKNPLSVKPASRLVLAVTAAVAVTASLASPLGSEVTAYLAHVSEAWNAGFGFPLQELGEAGLQYLTVSSVAGILVLGSGRFRRE